MEFKLDGLDKPIVLPDEYMTVVQYERLQRYLHVHNDEPEDFRFVRECLAAFVGDPELLTLTNDLPLTTHNIGQWEGINDHLHALISGSSKTGDDLTNEAITGPLDESPTETTPPMENPTD